MPKLLKQPLFWIIALATYLRLFSLSSVPGPLNWDEVSMGVAARSILETGRDEWGQQFPLLFRSYGEWKSPVYIYLLTPFIALLGNTELAVRLPSALAGIFAVYLTYLIGSLLYSRKVGLFASLFLAVSPWHLLLSRPAFEANVSLTLILAGLYFFLKSYNRATFDMRYALYSALFFGLAPHTYNSAKVVVPLLVLFLVWRTRLYLRLIPLLLFGGVLALFALPLVMEMFSGRAQYRYTQVGVTTDQKALNEFVNYRNNPEINPLIGKLVFNKYTYALHATAVNAASYLSPSFLLLQAGDHHQHHVKYFGVLYLAEFVLLIIGLSQLSKQTGVLRTLPILIILLGIIPAALTRDQGHVLRSLLTLPGWQLLAALGLSHLQNIKFPYLKIIIGLLVIQSALFLTAYFVWYPKAFARDWQYGHKEVAEYLRGVEGEYDHVVMTKWFGEPQLFLAFYNNWEMNQYQKDNAPNLRYEAEGRLWLDQLPEYSIGKYRFKYIDYSQEVSNDNTLYIGKFDDFYENPDALKTIYYPDGTVAFHIVRGKK